MGLPPVEHAATVRPSHSAQNLMLKLTNDSPRAPQRPADVHPMGSTHCADFDSTWASARSHAPPPPLTHPVTVVQATSTTALAGEANANEASRLTKTSRTRVINGPGGCRSKYPWVTTDESAAPFVSELQSLKWHDATRSHFVRNWASFAGANKSQGFGDGPVVNVSTPGFYPAGHHGAGSSAS